jgi:hypothetical protein
LRLDRTKVRRCEIGQPIIVLSRRRKNSLNTAFSRFLGLTCRSAISTRP